jgi:hypothetical protein
MPPMKATIDVPDDLYRKVKARSALLGKPIREVTIELYERWLAGDLPARQAEAPDAWLRGWLAEADAAVRAAPVGRAAREELEADRDRLDRR